MHVPEIQRKIDELKQDLLFWENYLKDLQQNCQHTFEGETLYRKCLHCEKIEVLYY
ncbi:hypothetical protein JCM9140_488 [Halalkalibacter wakoensis JCM 9140]|uniref:Uncharacterized protein n=1 Tax=Halalkalibacter wakoensis JCM 9140 TaxID=1236970 RepID=W4PXH7_9BACI|nr:serine protease [Halalkalibacter wakoensis]GAE24551.1 hypothetical protein JCM9140_488 [Halalkalibacter wakoensis JCM 9140]